MLVVPADITNPVSHFDALSQQLVLPPLMAADVMFPIKDRDFPRHYLLLQDGSAPLVDDRK